MKIDTVDVTEEDTKTNEKLEELPSSKPKEEQLTIAGEFHQIFKDSIPLFLYNCPIRQIDIYFCCPDQFSSARSGV